MAGWLRQDGSRTEPRTTPPGVPTRQKHRVAELHEIGQDAELEGRHGVVGAHVLLAVGDLRAPERAGGHTSTPTQHVARHARAGQAGAAATLNRHWGVAVRVGWVVG